MKKQGVLSLFFLFLVGCSNSSLYHSGLHYQKQKCLNEAVTAYQSQQCIDATRTFNEYNLDREELINQ